MDEETRWQENEAEEDHGYEKTALMNRQSGGGTKQVWLSCSWQSAIHDLHRTKGWEVLIGTGDLSGNWVVF